MADAIPAAAPVINAQTTSNTAESRPGTGISDFLKRARGVVETPQETTAKTVTEGSDSTPASDTGSVSGNEKQGRSDTYAEGGLTKFYEPIPEYEGRHRWDPHAEWTEAEEKKLIRKVDSTVPTMHCSSITKTPLARLQNLFLGMSHVFRASAGQGQYFASSVGWHAR